MPADQLMIERTFDAPLALVWRIWESREHLIRWWGPKDFTCTALEWELRVGAKWKACIVSAKHLSWMSGEIREVAPKNKIAFTFAWKSGEGPKNSTITITFEERDGKTLQRFHQDGFTSVADRDSHTSGWTEFIDDEQKYIEHFQRFEKAGS
jgi:uncharacterized protein YndB with AHSA1/START domain